MYMNTQQYLLKLSPQGQLTLPKELRLRLRLSAGSRVSVQATASGKLKVSGDLPIAKYFGTMGHLITGGQDAAQYIRELRNEDNRRRDKKLGI